MLMPQIAIQRAVLDRFHDVGRLYSWFASEIGDDTAYFYNLS